MVVIDSIVLGKKHKNPSSLELKRAPSGYKQARPILRHLSHDGTAGRVMYIDNYSRVYYAEVTTIYQTTIQCAV